MFNAVDAIGVDSVCKLIEQVKLPKFVIFRQGIGKNAIPVFEFITGDNTPKAVHAFKNWAASLLMANPYNAQAYDILLFNKKTDFDLDDDDETHEPGKLTEARKRGRNKENKIRFSFQLCSMSPYSPGGMYGMGGAMQDVNKAVEEGIARAMQAKELADLKERVRQMEEGEDEEDEEEKPSGLDKVYRVLREIRLREGRKKKGAQIAGDEDDEDDEDYEDEEDDEDEIDKDELNELGEDDEEEQPTRKKTMAKKTVNKKTVAKKREMMKKALIRLAKHCPDLPKMLTTLADFADGNPKQFKTYMNTLEDMV